MLQTYPMLPCLEKNHFSSNVHLCFKRIRCYRVWKQTTSVATSTCVTNVSDVTVLGNKPLITRNHHFSGKYCACARACSCGHACVHLGGIEFLGHTQLLGHTERLNHTELLGHVELLGHTTLFSHTESLGHLKVLRHA